MFAPRVLIKCGKYVIIAVMGRTAAAERGNINTVNAGALLWTLQR